jgi:antitoxin component of MazEF toxin-antitoxin module
MSAVKIRRQGNSLAVTLDQDTLGAANLHEGDLVQATVRGGVVVLTPVEIRPKVIEAGRKVIAQNRNVLDRLAKDDRGASAGRG